MTPTYAPRGALAAGATLLGIGLGGFVDGIVLHQILQWHHMVSSVHDTTSVAGLQANTLADGLFHAATWLATVIGLALAWRGSAGPPVLAGPVLASGGARWSTSGVIGFVLIGWGAFNVADGVVNHWLLGLHHIREGADWLVYDVVFAVLGGLMLVAGVLLQRAARRREPAALTPEEARRAVRRVA